MNERSAEIDRLVQSVLAELRSAPPADAADAARCAIDAPVVTLATLQGRLDGVNAIAIRRGAVVTPAVRDELRARNIRLEICDAATPVRDRAAAAWVLGVADVNALGGELAERLRTSMASRAAVHVVARGDLPSVVGRVAEAVVGGSVLGVVLSSRPAAAAGLANRHRGVRAACGGTRPAVREALAAFAANVLAWNPARHPFFEQHAALAEFVRGGVRDCPAEFRDAAG